MAESVFVHILKERGLSGEYVVSSAATHTEELGNPPHRGTVQALRERGIPVVPHRARLLSLADGDAWDYIIGMDAENFRHMRRILGECYSNKISLLLDYTDTPRAIADPWYTGNFDETYGDIREGLEAFLAHLEKKRG